MDKQPEELLEQIRKNLRPGAEVEWISLPPSGPDTTGFSGPLVRNISLTDDEQRALGIVPIGGIAPKVDLLLTAFTNDSEPEREVWEDLIYKGGDGSAIYKNLANSVMPLLRSEEVGREGISVNGRTVKDMNFVPRNIFLASYLKALGKKKILLTIGHSSGDIFTGKNKQIGSDTHYDRVDYVLGSLDKTDYSTIVDTTCSSTQYVPNLDFNGTLISARRPVVLIGTPNEEQCESVVMQNGRTDIINWRPILQTRRVDAMRV